MSKDTRVEVGFTMGIDLGDRTSELCVLSHSSGCVMERSSLATTVSAFRKRFSKMPPTRVALEAGGHSLWVTHLLEACGHRVIVANPSRVRVIYQNQKKTDRTDAEWLARLARMDEALLSPVQHRSAGVQADLTVLRSRAALVRTRAALINHVRGTVKTTGTRLVKCSTPTFHRVAGLQIPDSLQPALEPVLSLIESVSEQIALMNRTLEQLAQRNYPQVQALTQVNGVGPLTALGFVLTIEDPQRFARNRAVGPYLGLVPRQDQSGAANPQLRITKSGDTHLRSLLVQAAHYIIGPFGQDCDLRRFGLGLMRRGGKNSRKRAVIAVARRLAVLLLALWKTGEVYEPLRHAGFGSALQAVR